MPLVVVAAVRKVVAVESAAATLGLAVAADGRAWRVVVVVVAAVAASVFLPAPVVMVAVAQVQLPAGVQVRSALEGRGCDRNVLSSLPTE